MSHGHCNWKRMRAITRPEGKFWRKYSFVEKNSLAELSPLYIERRRCCDLRGSYISSGRLVLCVETRRLEFHRVFTQLAAARTQSVR